MYSQTTSVWFALRAAKAVQIARAICHVIGAAALIDLAIKTVF